MRLAQPGECRPAPLVRFAERTSVEPGEIHAELPAPMRETAKLRGVTEQAEGGHLAGDDGVAVGAVGGLDQGLALLEVAEDGAEVLVRHHDLHPHHRLQGAGAGLRQRLAEGAGASGKRNRRASRREQLHLGQRDLDVFHRRGVRRPGGEALGQAPAQCIELRGVQQRALGHHGSLQDQAVAAAPGVGRKATPAPAVSSGCFPSGLGGRV
jgi:hypothetical protein